MQSDEKSPKAILPVEAMSSSNQSISNGVMDQQLVPGTVLMLDPGTEILLAPCKTQQVTNTRSLVTGELLMHGDEKGHRASNDVHDPLVHSRPML
jgi:hypothetical protein